MKVAFDTSLLSSGNSFRGIGVHTKELMNMLSKMDTKNVQIDFVDFEKTNLSNYDVAHFQYFHPNFLTIPFFKKTKYVVTIHDLIRLIYPRAYPPGIKGSIKFYLQKFNLRNVDAVITISETSKKDIVRLLGIPANRIFVTHLAPQSITKANVEKSKLNQIKIKYNLPDKFMLYVGDVNFNKNLLRLAEACKKVKVKLVIVGKQAISEDVEDNIENASWKKFMSKYKNDKDIIRLGYLESEEFDCIYKLATVYCQPSLYEGFGLPILEAMARDCAVVAARNQAHVEIAESACLFFDPTSVDDMAEKIKRLLHDQNIRHDLIKKGNQLVKKYTWEDTAKQTMEVYKKVYEGSF